ncbi:MAG: hypothetical protein NT075_26735 [Chloroflexi bacterium]|nr:hypothetical protein [Chloroflexota bacterium]
MNPTLVTVNTHPSEGHSRAVTIPVFIPNLDDVRILADRLHVGGKSYHDRAWGWEVTYEPELDEPEAEVEVPDGKGGFVTQAMPLWTPASFTIGESGVWFFSLLWENGSQQPPVEFLDNRNIVKKA